MNNMAPWDKEDVAQGKINCPHGHGLAINVERGCNHQICMHVSHGTSGLHFCFGCRKILGDDEEICSVCPRPACFGRLLPPIIGPDGQGGTLHKPFAVDDDEGGGYQDDAGQQR